MASNSKLILVTGDSICDNNYYKGERPTADSTSKLGFRDFQVDGGALLLKELIKTATVDCKGWRTEFALDVNHKKLPPAYHAFCLWEPQPAFLAEDSKQQELVWRAVEPPLGYGHDAEASKGGQQSTPPSSLFNVDEPPQVLVIDDAGLGFRRPDQKANWPFRDDWSGENAPHWVVLKVAGSIGTGDFWDRIVKSYRDNLIVIVSADQIRLHDVRVSRGLSWEATIEDISAELDGNPLLKPLLDARHLIVTFGSAAAFWLDNKKAPQSSKLVSNVSEAEVKPEESQASESSKLVVEPSNAEGEPEESLDKRSSMLVFDASMAEGEWEESQGKGAGFGYTSCFAAAIVHELVKHELAKVESAKRKLAKSQSTEFDNPDFEAALTAGLGAGRMLRRIGHGRVYLPDQDPKKPPIVNPEPGFPYREIAEKIVNPTEMFVSAPIPQANRLRGEWMMLDSWQVNARGSSLQRLHMEAALAVAILGAKAIDRFPVAKFGDLQTVDRNEIESLRTIRHLINSYKSGFPQKKPLSIGVFGPPGAGKSFGVTQIAMEVLHIKEEQVLTFNLSQFTDTRDLIGAFHRIRDAVLAGQTPFVFWDEFDSQGYKWLQYLLAPMQDGAFQEGQITHPITNCVFVFAGATSPTYGTFGPVNPENLQGLTATERQDAEAKWLDFVLKKGPDFMSRLVGYLNVLGPNQRQTTRVEKGRRVSEDDPTDLCCPIRRALFIRAQFWLKPEERLHMDPGVLRALLEIKHYKSGSRSLEYLCKHLRSQSGGTTPRRSHLPGNPLLNLHVEASAFWNICERDLVFASAAKQLAEGFHTDWFAELTDDERKKNSNAVPWADLDPETRASNLAQAARIPTIVAIAGLRVVPGLPLDPDDEAKVRATLKANIEVLAEAEHNNWMVERLIVGWRYARIKDKDASKKLHPTLLPYAQISQAQQRKDQLAIIGQPATDTEKAIPDYIERVKSVDFRIERVPLIR